MDKKAALISDYFATIYLTFISLLQGVVLSQLIPNIITYFELAEHPWGDIHILPLMIMMVIIFTVWHHYAIGIFFLRWFPNIIDAVIPFTVTVIQFFLISYITIQTSVSEIDVQAFTKGFAIFLFAGCLAYFAAAWRIEPNLFTNIMNQGDADQHGKYVSKYYNLAGWSILIQGLFAYMIVLTQLQSLLLVSLILFLIHLVLSEYVLIGIIKPHFLKSMDEHESPGK